MLIKFASFASVLLVINIASALQAADEAILFFEQKIRPVLAEHCYPCHSNQANKLKGNLYLDSKLGWEKGGDSGEPVIIPGDSVNSPLIRAVMHLDGGMEMPPDKPKLSDEEISDLIRWVKTGAADPRENVKIEAKRGDKSWWSLQPLRREFEQNHIDDFIETKLSENNLTWNPPADPRVLIRRMTYDLHGLPPTIDDVEAFSEAFERDRDRATQDLVDRLLGSPRYGERWGRHWLDVIRFGESNGFERNVVIDDLWPFRDYVIASFNDDKPFNQFIIEHLAGDAIGQDDPRVEVGSAFLVAGPYDDVANQSVEAQANIRAATLDDIITATSGAFLGLTIHCARCHDHKFDPIPTEDYYRLRSAFEGVTHGRRTIATKEQRNSYSLSMKPLNAELKKLEDERNKLDGAINEKAKNAYSRGKSTRPKIDPHGTTEEFTSVDSKYLRFVIHGYTDDFPSGLQGRRSGARGGKLTEFQVWSAADPNLNVALASNGTTAEGARSATAEDFPEAYGPQYCIDGMRGEAWFIGEPAILTLTFAKMQSINRITFINARGDRDTDEGKVRGASPCEYEVQVSRDGNFWQTVASDEGREPWSEAHGIARERRRITTEAQEAMISSLTKRIGEVQRKIASVSKLPQIWAGNYSQPASPTVVHKGGDPMKPGEPVAPSSLAVLDKVTEPFVLQIDAPERERRLALAKWITSRENPLTPRVLANRVWQYHFGTGIVDTPSDFGFLGSKPVHPELLDFLANRLIANDWKLKPLHREIMLSRTYLQSSTFREDASRIDKDSRLLWRFPSRRLSAEEIRDTILSVADKLKLDPMGGPGFRLYKFTQNNVCTYFPLDTHGPETYRRAVYHQNPRASVVDVLSDFDLPDNAFAAPRRANTTTPLQALTLFNHSFTLDMSVAISARIADQDPVIQSYRFILQRDPTLAEFTAARQLVRTHGAKSLCRALLNANELLYIE